MDSTGSAAALRPVGWGPVKSVCTTFVIKQLYYRLLCAIFYQGPQKYEPICIMVFLFVK